MCVHRKNRLIGASLFFAAESARQLQGSADERGLTARPWHTIQTRIAYTPLVGCRPMMVPSGLAETRGEIAEDCWLLGFGVDWRWAGKPARLP